MRALIYASAKRACSSGSGARSTLGRSQALPPIIKRARPMQLCGGAALFRYLWEQWEQKRWILDYGPAISHQPSAIPYPPSAPGRRWTASECAISRPTRAKRSGSWLASDPAGEPLSHPPTADTLWPAFWAMPMSPPGPLRPARPVAAPPQASGRRCRRDTPLAGRAWGLWPRRGFPGE
jgi:hypothetical protein